MSVVTILPRREVLAEGVELWLGDCLQVLPTIDRVDHVISDSPYEKEAHRSMRKTQASIKSGQNVDLEFSAIDEDTRDAISHWCSVACDGWALLFCQAEAVGTWRDALEKSGAKYKRTMIWVKPDSSPQFNGQMPAMGYESMPLAWCGTGHPRWNGGGRRGVFTHLTNQPDRDGVHQTEKPLPLMRELVSLFSNPEQVIADPFMGSGTTGVAAVKLGRRFIGIERDPHYYAIAKRRITEAANPARFIRGRPEASPGEALLGGSPMSPAQERALRLALHLIYPAFPCNADKTPACPHGFKAACTAASGLATLWARYPGELVGVPTGPVSGVAVLDVDKKSGGLDWWKANKDRLPKTRLHLTRSGGVHALFNHRPGLEVLGRQDCAWRRCQGRGRLHHLVAA
jgi:site-specific DNA-methyltransferase (adenine-specific)